MSKLIYSILALSLILSGCDDENGTKTINPENPEAISTAIKIENAQFIKQSFPIPSSDPDAPALSLIQDDQLIKIMPGEKIVISSILSQGDAEGFFVQVNGAQGYFNVSSSEVNEESGRVASGYAAFRFSVPKNVSQGTFTISYAVYDVNQKLSNIITRDVQVISEDDITFSDIQWRASAVKSFYNNNISVDSVIGAKTISTSFYCASQNQTIILPYVHYSEYQGFLSFFPDGQINKDLLFKLRRLNEEATRESCSIVLDTLTGTYFWSGSWAFDDVTNKLTIRYTYYSRQYEDTYEVEEIEPTIEEYEVYFDDQKLILSKSWSEWREEYHFKPRN